MSAEDLAARFAGGTATVATCWRLERRDGVLFGFTDHDNDLSFEDTTFLANTGLRAHAIDRSTGANVDTSQVAGALSAAAITERDILAGFYDGALVTQWLVDWQDVATRVIQFRARIGEIRNGDGHFEAELLGLTDALNRPVGRSFLRHCDLDLGAPKCGVDLSDPAHFADGDVAESRNRRQFTWTGGEGRVEGWFARGVLDWTGGANAGQSALVELDTSAGEVRDMQLMREMPFDIQAGDRFTVRAGCDKRASTCRDKFANLMNFRGFPHIPGSDWVTVYPRTGAPPRNTLGAVGD